MQEEEAKSRSTENANGSAQGKIVITDSHFEKNGTAIAANGKWDVNISGTTFKDNGVAIRGEVGAADVHPPKSDLETEK